VSDTKIATAETIIFLARENTVQQRNKTDISAQKKVKKYTQEITVKKEKNYDSFPCKYRMEKVEATLFR
jgi:hypothetical protein